MQDSIGAPKTCRYKVFLNKNIVKLKHNSKQGMISCTVNLVICINSCDRIGGTLKQSTTRTSLQKPLDDQILTPMDFCHYRQESISTITTYYTRAEEVEEVQKLLTPHFELATTIVGTQTSSLPAN